MTMTRFGFLAAAACLLAAAPAAAAEGWEAAGPADGHGSRLTYTQEGKLLYAFQCGATDVAASNYGVTKLLDVQTGKPVGDDAGASITPGASFMALGTDKADPDLIPATAAANPKGGWDMTVRLPKNHKAFLSLAKAGWVSLFTTGYTQAIALDKADRKLLAQFVSACRAEGG